MAFDHIGGAEPSTVTFKVATITQTRNSSVMHQELLTLADANSSLGVLPVIAAKPDSTHFGAVVRIASGPSSAVDFPVRAVLSSTGADNPVSVTALPANSSLQALNVIAATYLSTAAAPANSSALNVRVVGGASSAADFPVRATLSSTGADNPVSVTAFPANSSLVQIAAIAAGLLSSGAPAGNSSALLVRIVGGPSSAADLVSNVSSVSGRVATMPLSTVWASSAGFHFDGSGNLNIAGSFSAAFSATLADNLVTVYQSTATDLLTRPVFSSTSADNPVLATIGTHLQSSVAPSSNSSALMVRTVVDLPLTFVSTNCFASTLAAINSTAAGQRCKVFSYSITSTAQSPTKIGFYGGSSLKWSLTLAAISSAVTGANLAVSPPAFLFGCGAGSSMTIRTPSSVAGFKVSVGYFMGP